MPGLIPLNRLLAEIEENPIEGAKTAQKRYDGVRTANYESSISAGALYRELKKARAMQSAFYALPFWAEGNARDPKHLNKHCHQFVYGARDGSEGKRAEDHAYATQSYFDDDTKSLEEILKALENGGFDGLKKAAPAQRARTKKTEPGARKQANAGGDEKVGSAGKGAPHAKPPAEDEGDAAQESWPDMTKEEISDHLLVTVEPDELDMFLDEQSEVGDCYLMEVRREANDAQGGLVWRAITISKSDVEA